LEEQLHPVSHGLVLVARKQHYHRRQLPPLVPTRLPRICNDSSKAAG
jgi:hypothetical protein